MNISARPSPPPHSKSGPAGLLPAHRCVILSTNGNNGISNGKKKAGFASEDTRKLSIHLFGDDIQKSNHLIRKSIVRKNI